MPGEVRTYLTGNQQFDPAHIVPVKLHPKGGSQGQSQPSPYAADEVRIGPPPPGQPSPGQQPPQKGQQPKPEKKDKPPGQQNKKPAKVWKVGDRVTSKADKNKKGTIIDIRGDAETQVATVDWDDVPLSEALQPGVRVADLIADDSGGDGGNEGEGEGEGKDGSGEGEGGDNGEDDEYDPLGDQGDSKKSQKQENPGGVEKGGESEGEGRGIPKVEVQQPGGESEWKDKTDEQAKPLNPKDKQKMRTRPLTSDEIKEIIDADTINQGNGRASGGSSVLTNMLVKAYSTKTDWRTMLRKFLKRGEPTKDVMRSLKRPSRMGTALGRYLPSAQKVPVGMPHRTVVVAIDTSGSVFDQRFMDKFFSEVFNIVRTQNMDVFMIMWCDDAYYSTMVKKQNIDAEMKKVKLQTGGTVMSSVARLLLQPEHRKLVRTISGIIYITDLEVEGNPILVKGVPIAIFGPASLMNKYYMEAWRAKGVPVATYDDSNDSTY